MADPTDPPDVCSPFPPESVEWGVALAFDPAWQTSTVIALVRGIEADRAFDRFPILADALEDAGCTNRLLLDHFRAAVTHDPDCWAIRRVLEPAPVDLPPPVVQPPPNPDPVYAVRGAQSDNSGSVVVWLVLFMLLSLGRALTNRTNPPAPTYEVRSPGFNDAAGRFSTPRWDQDAGRAPVRWPVDERGNPVSDPWRQWEKPLRPPIVGPKQEPVWNENWVVPQPPLSIPTGRR